MRWPGPPWLPPLPMQAESAAADLARATWQGQFAFSFDLPNASAALNTPDLISFNLAVPHARGWTINLNAFRFHGGTISAAHLPDNQTNTAGLLQAKILYGVDTALETVLVDYPARGCSFQLDASAVRLSLVSIFNWPVTGPNPTFSGYACPTTGPGQPKMPTFTTGRQTLAAGNAQDFDIPARAVGYRYNAVTRAGIAALVTLEQIEPLTATAVQNDGTFTLVAAGALLGPNEIAPSYFPIARDAQWVRVTADAANTNQLNFTLSYVLDLG